MSLQQEDTAEQIDDQSPPQTVGRSEGKGSRAVINWVLALLTVPAAALIMVFAVGAAMSMAACSSNCPGLGPDGIVYGILFYGAPVVAALTIIVSFFTAFRRRGFVVPLVGLALLLADFAAIALLF